MFRFRLEKVLRHRRRLVDDEARKLQVIAARLNRLLAERRQALEDAEMAGQNAWQQRQGTVDIAMQRSTAAFIESRRATVRRLDRRLQDVRREADAQRARLVEAQQGVSVLESLEEKQRQDWSLQQRRREQKEFDELGARSASRTGH